MKASGETVLPFLGLALMATVLATQSLPITQAFAEVVGEQTDDVNRVAETRSAAHDYYFSKTVQTAAYSVNNASYRLGQDHGGIDQMQDAGLQWFNKEFAYSKTLSKIHGKWEENSTAMLNNEMEGNSLSCSVPDTEFNVTISNRTANYTQLQVNTTEQQALNATCIDGEGKETFYTSGDKKYDPQTNATDNRYMKLAEKSARQARRIEDELSKVGSSFEGDGYSCGSRSSAVEEAESEARNDIHSAVENRLKASEISDPRYRGLKYFKRPSNHFFVDDAGWRQISGDVQVDASYNIDTGDCDCDDDGDNCDTYYDVEVNARPVEVETDYMFRDVSRQVLVEDRGFTALEFRVEPFVYRW